MTETAEEERRIEGAFREVLDAYMNSHHRKKADLITRAFDFARQAHRGARRGSGEPYIMHPLAVARIVICELGLGSTSIAAALLHDVIERSDYTRDDIERNFGPRIASIVEGITKISGGIFGVKASVQAENFRKLLLSMSADVRVVLIKMADRLHNMRTLHFMRREKQLKVAGETLYVYAPLAERLGLFKMKEEFEDLTFRFREPEKYAEITNLVEQGMDHRDEVVEEFVAPLRRQLDEAGFSYTIKARVKSAYSIWRKMQKKNVGFHDIYDIYAVRIVFDNDDDALEALRCWQIYTIITRDRRVHPDRLRDWITTPKDNGYRALHLTVMGPEGKWIEVQIRSAKMDNIAEIGYAAHWRYKTGENDDEGEVDSLMNTIKDILANPEPNAIDFLDTIKLSLFAKKIYVFTPKGDLKTLPAGATVLDMAFAIHSELGLHCIGGKIAHRLVAPDHVLDSGDQVEIITSDSQMPTEKWLDYCHTPTAKSRLRSVLRKGEPKAAKPVRAIAEVKELEVEIIAPWSRDLPERVLHEVCSLRRFELSTLSVRRNNNEAALRLTLRTTSRKSAERLCADLRNIPGITRLNLLS
ncbi:MAG: bifunctional (p)ppGpp synthetase/guanosine-3',5'-bis(diphosphate) 3'-pyrophosphohydrolase [Bacteroidales bacterium]|nr:bifunctional (p)ppGpp synthetase/guanosine-3',5'-bis(diphosphate) 3'-pyrophosphohydrolase [Bacteroidales bacterium]